MGRHYLRKSNAVATAITAAALPTYPSSSVLRGAGEDERVLLVSPNSSASGSGTLSHVLLTMASNTSENIQCHGEALFVDSFLRMPNRISLSFHFHFIIVMSTANFPLPLPLLLIHLPKLIGRAGAGKRRRLTDHSLRSCCSCARTSGRLPRRTSSFSSRLRRYWPCSPCELPRHVPSPPSDS
jgi:hypothetical protein